MRMRETHGSSLSSLECKRYSKVEASTCSRGFARNAGVKYLRRTPIARIAPRRPPRAVHPSRHRRRRSTPHPRSRRRRNTPHRLRRIRPGRRHTRRPKGMHSRNTLRSSRNTPHRHHHRSTPHPRSNMLHPRSNMLHRRRRHRHRNMPRPRSPRPRNPLPRQPPRLFTLRRRRRSMPSCLHG